MDQTKDCTRELIAKAHNNDKEAREKLVTDNLGLIWNIIKRFKGRGTEQEDLFQIGCIGLIKAIDNFNLVRREVVNVPLVGTVAAGQPILAVENIDAYFPIPAEYMPNEQSFMLTVKGDSMINAGIFDGDQVLVKQQSTAENGDMVVALIDDSATVKTFYKENGYYRLQPENDNMEPIIITGNLKILGKVFGVFRFFS